MEKVEKRLDDINKTLEKMLKVMEKPEHPFMRGLLIAGSGVTALGLIHVIDTIINWFK